MVDYIRHFKSYPYDFIVSDWYDVYKACREYERPVHKACNENNIDAMKDIMKSGFTFDDISNFMNSSKQCLFAQSPNMDRPIHSAIDAGHIEMVKYLIDECGISINLTGEWRRTLMHYAAVDGDLEMVKYLVSNGATIDEYDDMENYPNMRPINYAAANDDVEIVKFLMDSGVVFDTRDRTWVAESGSIQVMKYIYENVSNENRIDDMCYVIDHGWNKGTKLDAIISYIKIGTSIDTTLLHYAENKGIDLEEFVGG